MLKKLSSRRVLKMLKNPPPPVSAWDEAASDAEAMLREAQDKVRQLAEAVRIFKRRRDKGEPFFGETSEETDVQG